ncbi:Hypothetical predicted protein [Xyrichtys novacula]|uniref:Uncharacterized protein n=1 Tax=Xyrichtys novacula TaxID=13765 RepID=A0AAV1F3Q8_XYRNO|nr:Hypothetical predicted protein [Xyrichtys novacula]
MAANWDRRLSPHPPQSPSNLQQTAATPTLIIRRQRRLCAPPTRLRGSDLSYLSYLSYLSSLSAPPSWDLASFSAVNTNLLLLVLQDTSPSLCPRDLTRPVSLRLSHDPFLHGPHAYSGAFTCLNLSAARLSTVGVRRSD